MLLFWLSRPPLISWASPMRRNSPSTSSLALWSILGTWSSSRSSGRSRRSPMAPRVRLHTRVVLSQVKRCRPNKWNCLFLSFSCRQSRFPHVPELCWLTERPLLPESESGEWICHQRPDSTPGTQRVIMNYPNIGNNVVARYPQKITPWQFPKSEAKTSRSAPGGWLQYML